MDQIRFATQSYKSSSLPLSAQRCVNMYAESEPPDAETPVAVFGIHGLTQFAMCGGGPVRGFRVLNGLLYVVSGPFLYSVTKAGVATQVGGSIGGSGIVGIAANLTQICIVNGVSGYIYSVPAGFQAISNVNFFPANTVSYIDGYFVFDRLGTNQWFISGIEDGTSFSGLDFASAEVQPGNVQATINQQESLLIFSNNHTETWYDAGAVTFPFQRYDGATIERGLVAPYAVLKEDNSVFFLGDDLIFYRLDGVLPHRISTHAIETAFLEYSNAAGVTDAFCYSYTYQGHKFIVLVFPTANKTWIFDIATSLWHERESWDRNGHNFGRWRGNCHITCYGKELIGDAYSGVVGFVDPTVNTEYGNTIRAHAIAPPVQSKRERVFTSAVELFVESGVGIASGQGSDPQLILDYSDDGGRTWRGPQRWSAMGKIGAYQQRLRWLMKGNARQRMYRVTITDPVRRTILEAHAKMAVGQQL